MNEEVVEILGASPGEAGSNLKYVRDPSSGLYLLPIVADEDQRKNAEEAKKLVAKDILMEELELSEEDFEAEWPAIWSRLHKVPSTREGFIATFAILDTGLMHDHPFIRGCIENEVDFTGEGVEDLNGHGTICTLIAHPIIFKPRLINIKVADAEGRGSPENLVKGIQWLAEYSREHPQEKIIANISLGVYSKKWGILDCQGDCNVCQAVIEAAKLTQENIFLMFMIAAGNKAGVPTCPGKVGLIEKYSSLGIMTVTSEAVVERKAARGNIVAPGTYYFMSIDQ